MRINGQAITSPSIELSVVITYRDLEHRTEEQLVEDVARLARIQIRSAQRHYRDNPPIEQIRAVDEVNQITRKDV